MKITKFGHSCLLVEENNTRILTDPGVFSEGHKELTNLDAILITHEHPDHCDIESLYALMSKNPQATVITNSGTSEIIKKAGIPYRILSNGEATTVKDILIEGFGVDHAIIHPSVPIIRNTGFLIAGKLFHPGDSYTEPGKPIEILALPTGGPWLKIADAIEYAKRIKPRVAFPIHDGMYKQVEVFSYKWPGELLKDTGTDWIPLGSGESKEF